MKKIFFLFLLFPLSVQANNNNNKLQSKTPSASGYIYTKGSFDATSLKFKEEFEGALNYAEAISWKSPEFKSDDPNLDAINEAIDLVKKAKQDGIDGKLSEAFDKLTKALKIYDENIYTLSIAVPKGKHKYRGVLKKLAIFAFYLNDKETSKNFIFRYLTMRPKAKFKKWPKEMKKIFKKIQKGFLEKGRGKLEVTTDPPGAKVYYKMKFKGPSPVVFKRVPPGEVILCITHPGFETKIVRFQFDTANPLKKHIVLEPRKGSVLSKYIYPAKMELGVQKMGNNLIKAAEGLNSDLLIMGYMDSKSLSDIKVTLFLFDRRIKKKLKEISKNFNPQDYSHDEIRKFVNSLFKGVDLSGIVIKPQKHTPKKVSLWTKLTGNKYFYPVLGGIGGSILAGAIITGIYLYNDKPSKPPIGGAIVTKF